METERLILRPWTDEDAETLFLFASDKDVGPAAGWRPHGSVGESREIIKRILAVGETYAIVPKNREIPVGSISLMFAPDSDVAGSEKECELGYWIGKPFWGQGLVPEAGREMLRHAFEDLGMECVWGLYHDGNVKSKRVQEKLGLKYVRTVENLDVPQLNEKRRAHVNRITREEWENAKKN